MACGANHSCAVDWHGKVYSWGFNQNSQLGHGHYETVLIPTRIKKGLDGVDIRQVACGETHSVFSNHVGDVYTCGWGHFCGHGEMKNCTFPRQVMAMEGKVVRQLGAGRSQTTCVTDVGEVWNFGIGACGSLGHNHDEDAFLPDCVLNIQNMGSCKVSAGYLHMVVLTDLDHHQLLMQDTGFNHRDPRDMTLLHRSVLTNNMASTKFLIDNGANFRAVDHKGQTVMHIAVHCGGDHMEVLKYLLKRTDVECFDAKDSTGAIITLINAILAPFQRRFTLF